MDWQFVLFLEFHYTPKERLAFAIGVLGLCVSKGIDTV